MIKVWVQRKPEYVDHVWRHECRRQGLNPNLIHIGDMSSRASVVVGIRGVGGWESKRFDIWFENPETITLEDMI